MLQNMVQIDRELDISFKLRLYHNLMLLMFETFFILFVKVIIAIL